MSKPEFVGPAKSWSGPRIALPGRAQGCIMSLLVLTAILAVPYFTFLDYVAPNQFGIKEVQIGINRGIQEEVYPPGYSLVIPFMQTMHKLPRNVQVLEMTNFQDQTAAVSEEFVHYDRAAKIQTSDGFFVDVDVSILYRIVDAHKAFLEYGSGQGYLNNGVLPRAEPVLKQTLGELTTEGFYKAPLRAEKTEGAKALLNTELSDHGILVEQVLVRYFKYTDRIQKNIEDKKLQDQLVFTNQSQRKAAEAEQNLRRVQTEGQAQVLVTLEDGKSYKVMKDAEKDLYVRTREAEADLLVQLSEAERSRLRNEALQQLGSDRYVAMEMAEVLKGLEYIVLPATGEGALNPLELDHLLTVFGVSLDAPVEGAVGPAATSAPNPLIEELSRDAATAIEAGKAAAAGAPTLESQAAEMALEEVETTDEGAVQ